MGQHALRLFGTIHLDRASKVADELDAYAADVDALFVEVPLEPFELSVYLRAAVRAPAFVVAMQFYGLVLFSLNALVNRNPNNVEALAVRRVAEERNLPVHMVDDHPIVLMADASPWAAAMNWVAVLAVAVAAPVPTLLTLVALFWPLLLTRLVPASTYSSKLLVALTGLWAGVGLVYVTGYLSTLLLAASVLVLLVTTLTTLSDRNEIMLGRIADLSVEHGYDSSCLVTGKGHVTGIVEVADAEETVDVTRSRKSKIFRRSDHETVHSEPDSDGSDESVDREERPAFESEGEEHPVGSRAIAGLVDFALAVFTSVLVTIAALKVAGAIDARFFVPTSLAGVVLVPLAYFVLFEAVFGRTPGKRLFHLAVTTTDGGPCTLRAALVRNLLRPVDFSVGYALALVAIALTDKHQRVGDLVAGTVVVRAK